LEEHFQLPKPQNVANFSLIATMDPRNHTLQASF